MADALDSAGAAAGEAITCSISDGFAEWMSGCGGSIVATTYQAGKVAVVGWDGRRVTLLMRQFDKPLGLAISGGKMALATRHDVVLLADAPLLAHDYLERDPGRYDTLYLPRVAYFTGDINAHDLAFGDDGLWVVNTRFSCLSQLSDEHSFVPQWKPAFVSEVAPEDRCHLNGLAVVDGRPGYVTVLGETDAPGAWRENKAQGGALVDVERNEVVVRELSMPHSPRWHDGTLWLLNSGRGELWRVNAGNGSHEVVCALPGYLRGLGFVGPFALVGLSQVRERHIFGGLPVQERFKFLACAIVIVDTRTGREVGRLEFTSGAQELFDVQFLTGRRRVNILSAEKGAVREAFTAPGFSYWLRPSAEAKGGVGDAR